MIVNHLNTFPYGGAATAARRLHHQLLLRQVDSRFLYHQSDRVPPADKTFQKLTFAPADAVPWFQPIRRQQSKRRRQRVYAGFNRHLAKRDNNLEVFSMAELPEPTRWRWPEDAADLVHLHWIAFFADYPSFFGSLPDDIPLVWTLHDMNPLTGGCHYSDGCERFRNGCGECPQVVAPHQNDLSAQSFEVKRRSLQNKNLTVVTPSRWLNKLAQSSPIWPSNTSFHVIHLGFDCSELYPVDKSVARQRLGIHGDAVLIGFGAEDIKNRRKGFHHLLQSLRLLKTDHRYEGLICGSGDLPANGDSLPKIHHAGYIDTQEKLREFYSACDLVIVPSREDNQPQMGLEAMACGTPVVGFRAGGIPEYVRPEVTGLLAELGNEFDLASQIARLVDDPQSRREMGLRARKMVETEFELTRQSDQYLNLYRQIAGESPSSRAA